jgi:serine/threonine-protein kinase RsbW
MSATARSTVHVAGTRSGIRQAIEAFDEFRAANGLRPSAVWQVNVALDEILSNIVTHAYGTRTDGSIDVTFALAGSDLEVTIVDDGPAVDPLAVPAPDVAGSIEARHPGGLGMHLVKALMDRVEYARRDGRNWLVLRRRLPASEGTNNEKG